MTRTKKTQIVSFTDIDNAIDNAVNYDLKTAFATVTKSKFREAEIQDVQSLELSMIVTQLFNFATQTLKLKNADQYNAMQSALLREVKTLRDHAQRIENIYHVAEINAERAARLEARIAHDARMLAKYKLRVSEVTNTDTE